jgi:PST family polysaccharide transporter
MAIRDYVKNPVFRKLTSNTSWLFGERIFQYALFFFISIWLAGYLGPTNLGILAYIGVIIEMFAPLATMGIDGIVIRELSREKLNRDELLGTAFAMRTVSTLVFIVLISVVTMIINRGENLIISLVIISSFGMIFRLMEVVDYVVKAELNSKYTVIARNIIFVMMVACRVTFILIKAPVEYFGLLMFVESFLMGSAFFIIAKKSKITIRTWRFNKSILKLYLKECWPLVLTSFAVLIYLKMDQVLVKNFIGDEQLGIYSIAVKFSELWYFIPSAIVGSAFPLIVKSFDKASEKYEMRLVQLFAILVWIGVASIMFNIIIAPFVIKFFYGPEFAQASSILAILSIGTLFTSLGYGNGTVMLSEGHTRVSLVLTVIGAVIAIVMGVILTPIWGVYGAAISSVVSYMSSAWLATLFFKSSRKFFFLFFKGLFYPLQFVYNRAVKRA